MSRFARESPRGYPLVWSKIRRLARKATGILDSRDIHNTKVVSLQCSGEKKGHALLGYKIEPFVSKGEELETLLKNHTNNWESLQMAQTLRDLGYDVDVISYLNETFTPSKLYDLYINARTNFQRIGRRLNPDCIKVAHLETAHWLFNNCEALKRYLSLQRRRGVTLRTRKMIEENWAIESADCATMLGNDFTKSTYAYANKPIYTLPVPTVQVYPWHEDKDYQACRKSFVWLGSDALVNKGLDLVLEAYSDMPDFKLMVCGPIEKETDFRETFYKELYQTANIKTVGWVDISGQRFTELAKSCVGLIYPSCSEGQSGAVFTCLQAGLIPVVSYQSGADVHDFGIVLNDCGIEEIKRAVRSIAERPLDDLKEMSRRAWTFAREHNTREDYAEAFRSTIEQIIMDRPVLRH